MINFTFHEDNNNIMSRIESLYENNKYGLIAYADKFVGDRKLSEDAVHSAFLSLIKNKKKYSKLDDEELIKITFAILKNKCLDILKKYKFISKTPIEEVLFQEKANENTLEEQAILNIEYNKLEKTLDKVDIRSKQILLLKYVLGYSYKEISLELGVSEKYVDILLMRAKQKVKKSLIKRRDEIE